ncbi:hypothetical protein AnigIFM49718_001132 [Aspergillus niger]|nr:hypothetical protein AnigIFM49718_001132 [Aspergillus niger]
MHHRSTTEGEMTTFEGADIQRAITDDIRIDRKHVLSVSLNAYGLPWKWDKFNYDYIIINKAMFNNFEEDLLAHTRQLRNERYITQLNSNLTDLEVKDRKRYRRTGLLHEIKRLLRAIGSRHKTKASGTSSDLVLGAGVAGVAAGGYGGMGGMEGENVDRISQVQYSEEEFPAQLPGAHFLVNEEVDIHNSSVSEDHGGQSNISDVVHTSASVGISLRANRSPSVSSVIAPSPNPLTQDGRRPGPAEFKNSRENRPLWLVERFAASKSEVHSDESLPSLPSSTTDVREPSEEEDDMEGIVNELLDRYTAA